MTTTNLHAEITTDFLNFGLKLEIGENVRGLTAKCIKETPKSKIGFKNLFYYRFRNDDERIKYLGNYLDKEKTFLERKELEKQNKKDLNKNFVASEFYKVGDVVINTWGYEQTNVEFYKVLEIKNKSIIVREICSETVKNSKYSHGMACNLVPDLNNFVSDSEPFMLRLKIKEYNGVKDTYICNPKSFYYFHKWNGKPQYCSWYN